MGRTSLCRPLAESRCGDLDAAGILSKRRYLHGGKPIPRGALYLILQNRIYRGEIVHFYPGEHDPIVDEDLWQGTALLWTLQRLLADIAAGGVDIMSMLATAIYMYWIRMFFTQNMRQ